VVALLALSAVCQGDAVGGFLFGKEVVGTLPPVQGRDRVLTFLRRAVSARAEDNRTDLRPALRRVVRLRGQAVVVLVSDFLTSPPVWDPEVDRLLAACARRHETLAVVLPQAEPAADVRDIILEGRDAESGRTLFVDRYGREGHGGWGRTRSHAVRVRGALVGRGVRTAVIGPEDGCLPALLRLLRGAGRCGASLGLR